MTVRKGRRRPYVVRWVVEKEVFNESFAGSDLADGFRSDLVSAARRGEWFDTEIGLPESMMRAATNVPWYRFACDYVDDRWNKVSAKQRVSIAETLTAVTVALTASHPGAPARDILWEALRRWAFNTGRREMEQPSQITAALTWAKKVKVSVGDLAEFKSITTALTACAQKLDGKPASSSYYTRRRRVLYNVLKYAVQCGYLQDHPLDRLDWKPIEDDDEWEEIDPAVVPSPSQVRELLTAVSYAGPRRGPRLVAFFATMYHGMLRPGEATWLRKDDCDLPEEGWGSLLLGGNRPVAGREWTDSGEYHDERGLKARHRKAKRPVPIPPDLVRLLRGHIDTFGVAPDGRLFRTESGGLLLPSGYGRTWHRARELALPPEGAASVLAQRPYDLRHAGITFRLNARVPARQVADWAGNSVEVINKVYNKCVADHDRVWEGLMNDALGA
ncbi:tyrosine-type recombinase/integrase [Spirillospora sp. CA-294931]|uniref:tyrosine-type recombinase/integrase n=1 Tax=Spirillospora sp. CA-294931 TaxID=3240042 RepID=UPI003D93661D